jgi:uncharacterized membrane protein YqiK
MLPEIVDKIVSTVNAVDIEKVTVIDSGGQGTGVPGFMTQLPASVVSLVEQLETALGVDIFASMRPEEPTPGASGDGGPSAAADDARPAIATGGRQGDEPDAPPP